MCSLLTKITLAILLIVCISTQPLPPIWGGNMQYSVNVSFIYDDPIMIWNFTYYYNWNLKSQRYEHHAPKLIKCVFSLILLSVSTILVLLLLQLMDGLTSNIQLIIGVVNVKTNLVPQDQIGLQLKAIMSVLNYSMESELPTGQNQVNILIIITVLQTEPYRQDSMKSKKEILNNGISILKLIMLDLLILQNFNQNVKIFVVEDVHIIERMFNYQPKIDPLCKSIQILNFKLDQFTSKNLIEIFQKNQFHIFNINKHCQLILRSHQIIVQKNNNNSVLKGKNKALIFYFLFLQIKKKRYE